MLDEMLVALLESAMLFGVSLLLKSCSSRILGLDYHSWPYVVLNKASLELNNPDTGQIEEPKDVIVMDIVSCFFLQNVKHWPTMYYRRKNELMSLDRSDHRVQGEWCNFDMMKQASPKRYQAEWCAQECVYRMSESENSFHIGDDVPTVDLCGDPVACSCSSLTTLKSDFCCSVTDISCNLETVGNLGNTEYMRADNSSGLSSTKEISPNETCNVSCILLSTSDCVYNHNGQLVRMTVYFDVSADSDTLSVCSTSNISDCGACSDSDSSEDFIVFDRSAEEDVCCVNFGFSFKSSDLNTPASAKFPIWSSSTYCKDSVTESFDKGLDTFVTEIQQPDLYINCKEYSPSKKNFGGVEVLNNNVVLHVCADKSDYKMPFFQFGSSTCKAEGQKKSKKKVQFKPDSELTVTYHMITWNFAYKQARKGPWQIHAVDRLRFEKRIKELDSILTPVLLAKMDSFSSCKLDHRFINI